MNLSAELSHIRANPRFTKHLAAFAVCCVGVVVAILLVGKLNSSIRTRNLERACERLCRWAFEHAIAPGTYPAYSVPASLSLPTGSVANLVVTPRGQIFVLLKTDIGWKGNYTGVLYSTQPITGSEIGGDNYGRKELEIPNIDVNPPIIETQLDSQFFRVYFDLG